MKKIIYPRENLALLNLLRINNHLHNRSNHGYSQRLKDSAYEHQNYNAHHLSLLLRIKKHFKFAVYLSHLDLFPSKAWRCVLFLFSSDHIPVEPEQSIVEVEKHMGLHLEAYEFFLLGMYLFNIVGIVLKIRKSLLHLFSKSPRKAVAVLDPIFLRHG